MYFSFESDIFSKVKKKHVCKKMFSKLNIVVIHLFYCRLLRKMRKDYLIFQWYFNRTDVVVIPTLRGCIFFITKEPVHITINTHYRQSVYKITIMEILKTNRKWFHIVLYLYGLTIIKTDGAERYASFIMMFYYTEYRKYYPTLKTTKNADYS